MDRRNFIKFSGIGMGAIALPMTGNIVSAAEMLDTPMDIAYKKKWQILL
ncbi:twin-arginine translocation signal domain-containing protein [Thalassotalea sp. ND16A]|nr:twin-arginine translocation signal domain-containing protein [Thalassotalea sp. ND16A]